MTPRRSPIASGPVSARSVLPGIESGGIPGPWLGCGLERFLYRWIRIVCFLLWAGLLVVLIQRHFFVRVVDLREGEVLRRGREESFMGMFYGEQRVGYVKYRMADTGPRTFLLTQEAFFRLNVLDTAYPVSMRLEANIDRDFILRDFDFHFISTLYAAHVRGSVTGSEVVSVLRTGKDEVTRRIALASPPRIATNRRAHLLQKGIEPGDRLRVSYFDPMLFTEKDTVVEYRGREKILVKGRVQNLHHFVEDSSGVRVGVWLDDTGRVVREESPAGFVLVAEPEFQARDLDGAGPEILSSVAVPVSVVLPDLEGLVRLEVFLETGTEEGFHLGVDRQRYHQGVLEVRKEDLPENGVEVCSEPEELQASAYIHKDHPRVAGLVREVLEGETDPLRRVRLLAGWVYENLEKRPVIGVPDAVTTLGLLAGDCNEHAVLFAAMARNAGIPARVAAGVMYHRQAFFYHAWNEVCLDGRWISLDTTLNQFPADVGHIKFVQGELSDQMRIAALLGTLQIKVLAYE